MGTCQVRILFTNLCASVSRVTVFSRFEPLRDCRQYLQIWAISIALDGRKEIGTNNTPHGHT